MRLNEQTEGLGNINAVRKQNTEVKHSVGRVFLQNKSNTDSNFLRSHLCSDFHCSPEKAGKKEKLLVFLFSPQNLCSEAANKNSDESEIIDERVEC